jgi:ribonuclease P protein component
MSVAYVPCGDEVRVAYAIGRQVGPAVVRNRLRRRLRAAVREVDVEIGGLHPGAYLVSPSRGAVGHHYDELRADLRRAAEAAAGGPASPAVGR